MTEIKQSLLNLAKLVTVEVQILRQIEKEGAENRQDAADAIAFAKLLASKCDALIKDAQCNEKAELLVKALRWSEYFGGIYRIVDTSFGWSVYESVREKAEEGIYKSAIALYEEIQSGR